jgi:hypothetical protein
VNSSSGALTILAIGTCRITANNSGTASYSAAPQRTQDIPVSSGSLAGLNPDDLDFLTSAFVAGSMGYTLSASSSDTELSVTIPSNALPSGTLVKIYLNRNLTTAGQSMTSTTSLLNFVIGWVNTNDGSLPIATSPLVINAVNASIKKGMVGYGILNGVPTPLGTATSDGSITLYLTEDPLLVVAPTTPDAPTGVRASSGLAQSSVVSWTAPSNDGGEPISGYEVTASPGGGSCTADGAMATSCTLSNLQNGTSYTFTVHAINRVGPSNPSSAIVTVGDQPLGASDGAGASGSAGASDGAGVSGSAGAGAQSSGSANSAETPTTSIPSPSPSVLDLERETDATQPTPTPRALPAFVDSPVSGSLLVLVGGVAALIMVTLLITYWRRKLTSGR